MNVNVSVSVCIEDKAFCILSSLALSQANQALVFPYFHIPVCMHMCASHAHAEFEGVNLKQHPYLERPHPIL